MKKDTQIIDTVWSRDYFSQRYDEPFLFLLIYGVRDSELTISREKHNIDGYPDGLDLIFYDKGHSSEQKQYIESFLKGTSGDRLKAASPEIFALSVEATSMAVVTGQFPDSESLNYLKNSIGVIKALTETGAVSVLDVQTIRIYSAIEWSEQFFEPKKPQPHKHAIILYSEEADGLWVHTLGMRTFGRPDISLVGWPVEKFNEAQDLANRFIEMYAYGAFPEDKKEIQVSGLPAGLQTQLSGGYDNHDFNNYYIEVKWNKEISLNQLI